MSSSLATKKHHEAHLAATLKRQVRELQADVSKKKEEIDLLKGNIRNTKTYETEQEIQIYMEECLRLRASLEEVIKSKDTFADPRELELIEQSFKQRDDTINQLKQKSQSLEDQLAEKED